MFFESRDVLVELRPCVGDRFQLRRHFASLSLKGSGTLGEFIFSLGHGLVLRGERVLPFDQIVLTFIQRLSTLLDRRVQLRRPAVVVFLQLTQLLRHRSRPIGQFAFNVSQTRLLALQRIALRSGESIEFFLSLLRFRGKLLLTLFDSLHATFSRKLSLAQPGSRDRQAAPCG